MELRSGRRYQTFKAAVRNVHQDHGLPCALCDQPINYALHYPHPLSWSLDHIRSMMAGGAVFDPANTQPSHLRCNQSRGASEGNAKRRRRREPTQTPTSARW